MRRYRLSRNPSNDIAPELGAQSRGDVGSLFRRDWRRCQSQLGGAVTKNSRPLTWKNVGLRTEVRATKKRRYRQSASVGSAHADRLGSCQRQEAPVEAKYVVHAVVVRLDPVVGDDGYRFGSETVIGAAHPVQGFHYQSTLGC
jgi:hypothetical protein